MDCLQERDFEEFSESAAKKALNHNVKHVMKEGGRATKALMINTDKLISTVQILGSARGVAKAAQAISVTTGVMSALFLALDVFFLAKNSHELRKGAKTKFAGKIRQVCRELQEGLLDLNKVKTQLQKTMDGIEVEEYEEIEEVEVEVDLESDPKKLAELEQEIDILEEELDKKGDADAEEKRSKEGAGRDIFKLKKEKKEKGMKESKELEEENIREILTKSKPEKSLDEEKTNESTKEEERKEPENRKTNEYTNKMSERTEKMKEKIEKESQKLKPRGEETERRSRVYEE